MKRPRLSDRQSTNCLPTLRLPALARRAAGLHRDQRGAISIASVFALMLLVMLLGLVMNSGQQADQKLKMQNAADAASYSGGVVLSRSMNTLAFTNHLLSDVFALTAFYREARDRYSESLTPEILDRWEQIGPILAESPFPKFAQLGTGITQKVPLERDYVLAYSEMAAASSEMILPVLEDILAERRIPTFQRALVLHTPRLTQYAADQVAQRHGRAWPRSAELHAAVWRTVVDPVGGASEQYRRTVPVIDPVMDELDDQQAAMRKAKSRRDGLARTYLATWNNESLRLFDLPDNFSQFGNLWRIFTCGQLDKLLNEEYPETNLPHLIRTPVDQIDNLNQHLEDDFMFVGVVYREPAAERIPGVFKNPMPASAQAYAQVMVYVPRRRLIIIRGSEEQEEDDGEPWGGVPGSNFTIPRQPPAPADGEWFVGRQNGSRNPEQHDLFCQNWSTQLVPATTRNLPRILSTPPMINNLDGITPADVSSLTAEDLQWLSHH